MKYLLALIASMTFGCFAAASAHASEWGCEVLLCAASSNPSWRGVAACHPPMEKLISEMKEPGFSWPTCPEGGAGSPGYERYAQCPKGWTPTDGGGRHSNLASEQSRCMHTVNQCSGRRRFFGLSNGTQHETTRDGVTRVFSGENSCSFTEYTARPMRKDPYFFDIKDEQTRKPNRFWFNLDR